MKKNLLRLIAVTAFLCTTAFVFYNTTTGQDVIFKRLVSSVMQQAPDLPLGIRVVICGSASPLGNDPNRAQACIAVVTPEHFFIFDTGARSPIRMAQARLPMARINGVFLTHFHSDHIAALPDVNLASWIQGRKTPLMVHGPTGVQSVVDGFNAAYQLDRKYRTAHHGPQLLPPDRGHMQASTFTPGGVVWQDELLTITSFLVEHPPIEPAVGYRVDYRDRSVVISGDTNAADTLFTVAKNADLLLHDALSRALLEPMIAAATEKKIYDELHEIELLDYLEGPLSAERSFDIVTAADVFIYVGKLDNLFAATIKRLQSGALYVFSVENSNSEDFVLRSSGRYAQSRAYIENLADIYDFNIEVAEPANIRKHGNEFMPGTIYILKYK